MQRNHSYEPLLQKIKMTNAILLEASNFTTFGSKGLNSLSVHSR
jgi:hypothetical protein